VWVAVLPSLVGYPRGSVGASLKAAITKPVAFPYHSFLFNLYARLLDPHSIGSKAAVCLKRQDFWHAIGMHFLNFSLKSLHTIRSGL